MRPVAPLYRQLKPSKAAARERVIESQRARLQGAMIEAVSRHGYHAASVDEVVGLAGVSTATLYKLFGSKLDCFLATVDLVMEEGVGRISAAYRGECRGERDWRAGLVRAFEQFVVEVVEQPAASRLGLVEILAVGPAALARMQRGEAVFQEMIAQSLAQAGDGVVLPAVLVEGVVHGVWFVARMGLLQDRQSELAGASGTLLDWLLCYRDPVVASLPEVQEQPCPQDAPAGGVLTLVRPAGGDERVRLLEATAALAARDGYGSLSMTRICELAAVSGSQAAGFFDAPQQCFLAAFELLSARALARATRRAQDARSWPESACVAVDSLYRGVNDDPVSARVAFVEVFAAGPVAARRQAVLMGAFADVLLARMPRGMQLSALLAHAIGGAVWGIARDHVLREKTHLLPGLAAHASYLALAPLIGAGQAIQAIEEWQAGAGTETGQPA